MSTLMERLLDEFAVFDYATRVAAGLDSTAVPDPISYRMDDATWRGFEDHLEADGFAYSTESMAVFEDLEEAIDFEQYQSVAGAALNQLEAALQPNLGRDLQLFEPEIRRALEEEVVLRFHLAAGMVERSLTVDPTVLRAQSVFGEELTSILASVDPTQPRDGARR